MLLTQQQFWTFLGPRVYAQLPRPGWTGRGKGPGRAGWIPCQALPVPQFGVGGQWAGSRAGRRRPGMAAPCTARRAREQLEAPRAARWDVRRMWPPGQNILSFLIFVPSVLVLLPSSPPPF